MKNFCYVHKKELIHKERTIAENDIYNNYYLCPECYEILGMFVDFFKEAERIKTNGL